MEQQSVPSVDEIIAIFASGDVEARRQLITRCPAGQFHDMALMAAGFTTEGGDMQALQFMINSYQFAGPFPYGINFGEACFRLGRDRYTGPECNPIFLQAAGNGSVGWLTSLSGAGRHDEARSRGAEVVQWLQQHGDSSNTPSVKLRMVEAALATQDYDEAGRLLDSIDESQLNWMVQVTYRSARDRLQQYKRSGTELSDEKRNDAQSRLRAIFGVQEVADKPPDDLAYVSGLDPALDAIRRKLGAAADSESAVMNRIIKASALFHDPVAGKDPARIAPVERELRECRAWMKAHGSRDGENDACWPLYLCYSRTGRDREAVEALQALRHNLEQARAGIANPVDRAGITARYPHLYAALATMLYRVQDHAGLLSAIEASKGRALADVMAMGDGSVVADEAFADSAETIGDVLSETGGSSTPHYVTYLVDDDCTYAACVSPRNGGGVEIDRIECGRGDLVALADAIRDAAASGDPIGRMPGDLGERLAALVNVCGDFIAEGDHVCYCPDDAMHLLPLQAALHEGRPLAETVSVSRTHAARVLQQQLAGTRSVPDRAVVIEVPATVDAADERRMEVLSRAGKWLQSSLDTLYLAGTGASVAALTQAHMKDSLVHFATHGVYPPAGARGKAANPYRESGLLLAAGTLPTLDATTRGRAGDHLLSPERLVKSGARFDGAHVTLQACVSGLAREGLGGDALGLEWALFQLGASSILSSHWNVSAQTSSAFAVRFYARLVNERKTRATAWRDTVLEFAGRTDALAHPFHWSAFSLSGDWR